MAVVWPTKCSGNGIYGTLSVSKEIVNGESSNTEKTVQEPIYIGSLELRVDQQRLDDQSWKNIAQVVEKILTFSLGHKAYKFFIAQEASMVISKSKVTFKKNDSTWVESGSLYCDLIEKAFQNIPQQTGSKNPVKIHGILRKSLHLNAA